MKRTITTIALALALAAAGAHAQSGPTIEHTVSITPAFTSTTRTECTASAPSGGWLGPALGAMIGGGAGSQVGKGSGQAAAAGIGAALGAQAGAAVTNNGTPAQTCRDITERRLDGYTLRTNGGRDVFLPAVLVQQFNNTHR